MMKDEGLIKLPSSLGSKINEILMEKIGFVPRKSKIGILSFEYTKEELELVEKLSFVNPGRRDIVGIELLPNLRTLIIKSGGYTVFSQDKKIASIDDKDCLCISKCKNLENLIIENQGFLTSLDVSQLKKLQFLSVKRNSRLEEIVGLEHLTELCRLDFYGNELLIKIDNFDKIIMQNKELEDLNLDVLLFPDVIGYDIRTGSISEDMIRKLKEMNVSWHENLTNRKSMKINNYQMMDMHQKACAVLEEYVPKHGDNITTVIGIELYLSENVRYDENSLNHGHSYVRDLDRELPSIVSGPSYGANGAYNAFIYGTCVCEGYTRAMQYLLRLKGIKSHNVPCISGEDKLHMSTDKQDDIYKIYDLPDDGYHSIISIDDVYYLYDDPCWNACRYQKGDKTMPWTFLTKEEISRDHTLSFSERSINNNTFNFSKKGISIVLQRIADYRKGKTNLQEYSSNRGRGR